MATSLSPGQPSQPPTAGPATQEKGQGPLSSLNLGFLKSLTDKKSTREGNTPKRRGPKPDAKPALTRRQELNRQAQRTHRERKELYIKALEDEVLRLKEIYSNISQDKERLAEENRRLKSLLAQNGLTGTITGSSSVGDDAMSNPSGYGSSSPSGVAPPSSFTSAFTPPPVAGGSRGLSPVHQQHSQQGQHGQYPTAAGQSGRNPNLDYDQAGIDFVLTYDNPSKAYMSPPHQ